MSYEQAIPHRADTLIISDDPEAPTLLNPLTGQIIFTNCVGKRIVQLADGSRSTEEISRQISREFKNTPSHLVLQHTVAFLDSASRKGIVTWNRQI